MKEKEYTFGGNIKFAYKYIFNKYRSYKYLMALVIILTFVLEYMASFIPALAVYFIEKERGITTFVVYMSLIIFTNFALKYVFAYAGAMKEKMETSTRVVTTTCDFIKDTISKDYVIRESHNKRKLLNNALECLSSNWVGLELMYKRFSGVICNIIGLVITSSVILMIDYRIIIVLVAMTVVDILLNKYARNYLEKVKEEDSQYNTLIWTFSKKIQNVAGGKDIRVYRMEKWINDVLVNTIEKSTTWQNGIEKRFFLPVVSDNIFLAIRDIMAYGILALQVLDGKISIAQMLFFIGVISTFSRWLFGLVSDYNDLKRANIGVKDLRKFFEMENVFKHGEGKVIDKSRAPKIEFKNVYFKYEDEEKYIIKNLNLVIEQGENIALVGNNGAGKTTLVKLLCGFYKPTKGEILVNGVNVNDCDIEDYFDLVSVVFQDVTALPYTIRENVTGKEVGCEDLDRLFKALEFSGLDEKIKEQEAGIDTYLTTSFDSKGIELSGGEVQKLMLARVYYKDSKMLILDEPTSALDPLAESRMYENYNKLTSDKTSIFISHRLASTRFCDKVIFLEDGNIEEMGSHEELMKMGGKYAEIFEIQSHYYKKEKAGDCYEEAIEF